MLQLPNAIIYTAGNPQDAAAWTTLVDTYFHGDPMHLPAYALLYAQAGEEGYTAVCQTDTGIVLYPFICRAIASDCVTTPHYDIISPYGYGGPCMSGTMPDDTLCAFWHTLDTWMADRHIVSEFVRFPLRNSQEIGYPGEETLGNTNFIRSLQEGYEVIRHNMASSIRKGARRGMEHGLSVIFDDIGAHTEVFNDIYEETMARNAAQERYYFGLPFFRSLEAALPGRFLYALVQHTPDIGPARIVGGTLYLKSRTTMYAFLGGTRNAYLSMYANVLQKCEAIRWGSEQGLTEMVLGGGYHPNDGIHQFKKKIAPDGAVDFRMGKRVLMPDIYAQLVEERRRQEPEGWEAQAERFFPLYRAPSMADGLDE